jgi:hypothetical protein
MDDSMGFQDRRMGVLDMVGLRLLTRT